VTVEVPELIQELQTPLLDLIGIPRRPDNVGRYSLSNRLVNSLAHLVAQDGARSRLLACSTAGVLAVADANALIQLQDINYATASIASRVSDAWEPVLQAFRVVIVS
jgi:hypothetical protein